MKFWTYVFNKFTRVDATLVISFKPLEVVIKISGVYFRKKNFVDCTVLNKRLHICLSATMIIAYLILKVKSDD